MKIKSSRNISFDSLPRRNACYSDVLSVALSVYKIMRGKNLCGRSCFYVVLLSNNPQYVFDVACVLWANGISGTLCRKRVLDQNNKKQKMLALRVQDKNQEFIQDVQKTMADVSYFRDVVLPRNSQKYK